MPPLPVVAVAASGGRDSTALLHCTARAARDLDVEVHALHVHHGLQTAADSWLRHVAAQCRRWARQGLPVRFHAVRLSNSPQTGESVEAWARRERYAALARMAQDVGCSTVLLAHHRRDQAETFLLQALRGGGPAGLSAMPETALRQDITWMRPWLAHPREAIEAYVRRHRLSTIDDPSNADTRFARSRLRTDVWPALQAAFPDAEVSLSQSARRAQEAAACLAELAAIDLAGCTRDSALDISAWQLLSLARRAHLLRSWLTSSLGGAVPETLVQRLLQELPGRASGRWPAPGGELRLHRGALRHAPMLPQKFALSLELQGSEAGPRNITGEGRYSWPGWIGELQVLRGTHGGAPVTDLTDIELRARTGGERFQLSPGGTPRGLKKQFQVLGVPAWQRSGPLIYSGGRLLFVPGLGIDARRWAPLGEPALQLHWRSVSPAAGSPPGAGTAPCSLV